MTYPDLNEKKIEVYACTYTGITSLAGARTARPAASSIAAANRSRASSTNARVTARISMFYANPGNLCGAQALIAGLRKPGTF